MSLGGATVQEGRVNGAWEPGSLVDLERPEHETAACQMPAPIKPQAVAAFSFERAQDLHQEGPLELPTDQQPGGLLPAFMIADTAGMLHRQDGEFGLFDNPFGADLERPAPSTAQSPTALDIDWEMDLEANGSSSSLISTPVVVDYSDVIPTVEGPSPGSSSAGAGTIETPRNCDSSFEPDTTTQVVDPLPVAETPSLNNGADAGVFPDPEDLPLPPDQDLVMRLPDPELPELPSLSDIQDAGLLLTVLCSLASVERQGHTDDEDFRGAEVADDKLCDLVDKSRPVQTISTVEPALATPLPENEVDLTVPAMNIAIMQPDLVPLETPIPSIEHSSKVSQETQGATVGQSPEPVACQEDSPTPVSGASPPIVSSPSAAKPAKPRQRAMSGFSATIAETWRRGKASPLDIALAMQMRPGLGAGADPAFMVRFLMAAFGWFVIVVNGGID
jgi:hypothetical protein